jgi:hypothetical protein
MYPGPSEEAIKSDRLLIGDRPIIIKSDRLLIEDRPTILGDTTKAVNLEKIGILRVV